MIVHTEEGATARIPASAEYLTLPQASVVFQVSTWWLQQRIKGKKLHRYGEGKIWRVRRSEVEALFAGATTAADAEPEADSAGARVTEILRGLR